MSDNNNNTPAPATPVPVTKPPAATKRTPKRTGTLRQRFDTLVQPQLVAVDELPDALREVLTTGSPALREALGLSAVIPAGLLTDSEAVNLVTVHEAVADLAEQIKP